LKRHLKTYPAPRFWPVMIKEHEFTIRPAPGPHAIFSSMPLGLILRDVLGYATTVSEAKKLLTEGKVLIDGVVRRDYKFPVGLMDVVFLKPAGTYYRVVPDPVNKLSLLEINSEEAAFKLVRIKGKRLLKDKTVQLSGHDGRTFAVKVDDPFKIQLDYRIFDTVKVSLPEGEILERIALEPEAYASIIGGVNIGRSGVVREVPKQKGPNRLAKVTIDDVESTVTLKYIFPVGKGSPIISLRGKVA